MQSELRPCAHCGGEARLWSVIMPFDADCDSITVQCADCDAIGADVLVDQDVHSQSDLAALEVEAIAAWNTRASDAEITRLTEALRAAEEREKAGQPPIWPIGHGVVMVAHAIEQGMPLFFMRAMPDDLAGKPGDKSTHDVWHETSNAPTVTLAFADIGAIESHISALQALADDARQALAGAKP